MPSTLVSDLEQLELTFVRSNHSEFQSKTSNRKRLANLASVPSDVKDTLKDFEKSVRSLSNQLSILEALGGVTSDEFKVEHDITSFCRLTCQVKDVSSSVLSSSEASLYRSYIVISIQQDVARQVYESKLILNPVLLKQFLDHAAMKPLPLHLHRKYKMVESNMKRVRRSISVANKLLHSRDSSVEKPKEVDIDVTLTTIDKQFTSILNKISVLEKEISDLERQKKEQSTPQFTSKHRNNICYQLHQLNLTSELEDSDEVGVTPSSEEPIEGDSKDIEQDTAEYDDCDVSLNASALNDESLLKTSGDHSPLINRSSTGGLQSYGSLSMDESELLLKSRAAHSGITATPTPQTATKPRRASGFNNAAYWHGVKLNILKDKRPSFSLRSFEAFFDHEDPSAAESAPATSSGDVSEASPSRIPTSWRKKVQLLNHSTVSSLPLRVRVADETLGDWRHVKPCVMNTVSAPSSSSSAASLSETKPSVSPLVEALKVIEAYNSTESKAVRQAALTTAATATATAAAATKPAVNPFGSFAATGTASISSTESGSVNILSARSRSSRSLDSGGSTTAPAVDGNLVAIRSTHKRSDSVNSEDAPSHFNSKLSASVTPGSDAVSSSSGGGGESKRANRSGSMGIGDRTASGDEEGIASVDKSLGTIKGTNMLDITKKASPSSSGSGSSGVKTSPGVPTMATVADVDMTVAQITEAIHAIYHQHNPSKLDEIPKLLAKYKDRELEMLNKVRTKYNVPANSAKVTTTAAAAAAPGGGKVSGISLINTDLNNQPLEKMSAPDMSPRLTNTRSSSVFDLSGLTTPTGSTGKNPFAKTESPKSAGGAVKTPFGFNSSPVRTSPSGSLATPVAPTGFGGGPAGSLFNRSSTGNTVGFGTGSNSGTTTPFGTNAGVAGGGGIGLASAGSGSVFGGGFQSPFSQQSTAPATHTTPTNLQEVQQRVTAIYQQYNPMKISEIPSLMEKYRGRELQLIANLEKKYNVPPAAGASPAAVGQGFGAGQGTSLFNRSATVGGNASPFASGTPPTGGSLFVNKGSTGMGGATSPFAQQQQQQQATPFGQPVQTSPFGQQAAQPTNLNSLFQGSAGVMGTQSPFAKSSSLGGASLNPLGIAGSASGTSMFGNQGASNIGFGGGGFGNMSSGSSSSGTNSLFSGGNTSNTSSLFNRSPQTPFGQQPSMQQQATPNSLQEVHARVTAIYQQYNPMKISEIPSLMEKYRGRELQLIANLEKKYNVPPGAGMPNTGFGGQQASPFGQQTSLFGGSGAAPGQNQNTSLFGVSPGQQLQQTSSMFGSQQQQQSPFGGVSTMGSTQPQQSPFGGGTSGFGMSTGFGATPPQQQQQTPFGSAGGFGSSATTFGTSSPQQPTSLFGNSNSRGNTPGAAAGALSLFNRSPLQPQQQQTTPFGNNASRTTSGFGTPTPFGNNANSAAVVGGGSLFGNRNPSGFGATNTVGWGAGR